MAKIEKLIERLLSRPTDFTWEELIKILGHFGYKELKSGGSRRKFADDSNNVIALHKPHPQNILKRYVIDLVIAHLKERGKIKNE
jgi:predicted RNA binding protein YcfA (HicA-like mRNA interferase family)